MKYDSYSVQGHYPYGGPNATYEALTFTQWSNESPRIKGRLVLQPNPWSLRRVSARCTNYDSRGPNYWPGGVSWDDGFAASKLARAEAVCASEVRASAVRKLKDNNAGALGVSIASASQAHTMLRGSGDRLVRLLGEVEHFYRLSTARSINRRKAIMARVASGLQPSAGLVLEGFFGWLPLYQDCVSALGTLAQPWPPSQFLSTKRGYGFPAEQLVVYNNGPVLWEHIKRTGDFYGTIAFSAQVQVSNPNLWIANKLGLINLAGIAWDLVPWSFVANAFSNLGAFMGSLTDLAGVSLLKGSTTTKRYQFETFESNWRMQFPNDPAGPSIRQVSGTRKVEQFGRSLTDDAPPIVPYVRFPEWDVGKSAIAGALLVQRTNGVSARLGV